MAEIHLSGLDDKQDLASPKENIGKARTCSVFKNCPNAVLRGTWEAPETSHTPRNSSSLPQSLWVSSVTQTETFKEDDAFAGLHSNRDILDDRPIFFRILC